MQFRSKLIKNIKRITEVVSAILLVISSLLLFIQVIFRYILKNPLTWSEEIARYSIVLVVLLGTPLAFIHKCHPAVNLFSTLGFAERRLELLRLLFIIAFSGMLIYSSIIFTMIGTKVTSPALSIPMHYLYGFIFISGFMLLISGIQEVVKWLQKSEER